MDMIGQAAIGCGIGGKIRAISPTKRGKGVSEMWRRPIANEAREAER